jgi:ribosomal protein L7/L12
MFGRATQQQKQIDHLLERNRHLENLVRVLADRAGVGEAELLQLQGRAGAMIPEPCARLVAQGKVSEAIQVYREHTGVGLKEAKEAIDRYRAGGS